MALVPAATSELQGPFSNRANSAEDEGQGQLSKKKDDSDNSDSSSDWDIAESHTDDEQEVAGSDGDAETSAQPTAQRRRDPEGSAPLFSLPRRNTLGLAYFLQSIRHTVDCLYKIPIRHPAPLDRIAKEAPDTMYQHFDCLHIKDKFPQAQGYLVDRLGKMNSRRRRLLAYRERHHREIFPEDRKEDLTTLNEASQPIKRTKNEPSQAEQVGATQSQAPSSRLQKSSHATTFQSKLLEAPERGFDASSDKKSSVASTYTGGTKLEIPPRPRGPDREPLDEFECPYCFTLCQITSEQAWK
jgi:hypothetical protein